MADFKIRNVLRTSLCAGMLLSVTGCAAPIVGALGISELITLASVGGSVAFNKGASDLALDIVTGQNCRIVEGIVRKDRGICEPSNSVAAKEDFKGVVGFVAKNQNDLELVIIREQDTITGDEIEVATWRVRKRDDGQIAGRDSTAVVDATGSN